MANDLTTTAQQIAAEHLNKSVSRPDREDTGFLAGATSSLVSGALEVFGTDPLPTAEVFRAENPLAGTVTDLGGTLVPYLGTGIAASRIPSFTRFIDDFALKGSNSFTQGARRGVATFGPLEGSRLLTTTAINPDNLPDTLVEAGVNLGIEALGGGILGALASGGKVKLDAPKVGVGEEIRQPKQNQLGDVNKRIAEAPPDDPALLELQREAKSLELDIRLEEVGNTPVKIELDGADGREITRLFKDTSSQKGTLKRLRLAQTTKDFNSSEEVADVIAKAGLEGNFDVVSLPRYIGFGNKKTAATIQSGLKTRAGMTTLDDGTLLTKAQDGTFVMARKITGQLDEAKDTDEWVIWRTNEPGRFAPDVKEFADNVNSRMMFLRTDDRFAPTGSQFMDEVNSVISKSPLKEFRDAHEKFGLRKDFTDRMAKALGYEPGELGSSFAVQRGKAFVEHYLTPALHKFKNQPLSAYIWGQARHIHDRSRVFSQRLIFGEPTTKAAKGFAKIFDDPQFSGEFIGPDGSKVRSVNQIMDSLSDDDIAQFYEVAEIVAGTDDAIAAIDELYKNNEISGALRTALQDLNKIDNVLVPEVRAAQRAAGVNELNPLEGHLMLSRVWDGDFRAPIYNEAGEVVYVASGRTPKLADEHAQAVIDEAGLSGALRFEPSEKVDVWEDFKLADLIKTGSSEYGLLARANQKFIRTPQTFKERKGVEGFKRDFTRKELFDRVRSHISERVNHIADLTVDTSLDAELAQLHYVDPKQLATLRSNIRQLSEKPGTFSRAVNQATDTLLKPALGRNSATKISAGVNEFLYHTQLGMANLAFPVLNAMTFMQTVFPEMSYVVNAADNRVLRDYYEVAILGGSDFKPRGHTHMLSLPKMMMQSVKKMVKPDDLLEANLTRAHREGVVDPQLLNEFIGKTSEAKTTFKDVLDGEEPWYNFVRSLSTWLPSKSERFARGHAFVVGDIMGREVLGLQDEALYQFSKKFTERTMYNYGTADRALVMTGPVGRMFGLFKNWQTHYLFSMLQYADEGLKYGNWNPLMWQMGGTASVGGVSALPLYGAANAFAKATTNESLMAHIYEGFGGTEPDGTLGTGSDAILMGLPAFLGITLTGSASAPFSDPMRDAAQLTSFPQWDRMVRLGRAVGESIDRFGDTGEHPITNADVRDKFIAALAPKNFARAFQVTEENALKSLNTGKVVLNDLSLAERMLWSVGFTPRRVGITYEAADELWKDQAKRRDMTTRYGKLWMEAQAEGNWDQLWSIQQQAMVLGLDLDSVMRSADTQKEKRTTELISRQFSPEARFRLQELGVPGF